MNILEEAQDKLLGNDTEVEQPKDQEDNVEEEEETEEEDKEWKQ